MLNQKLHIILLLLLGFLCLPQHSIAQLSPSLYSYPNNSTPWYTIESEHFKIHFQEGNSRSAQATTQIAEHIYPKITGLYNLEPDTKTDIVLNDRRDYSNGAAYFFDNQIEIWVPALDTPLRGTHDWLWDVITHEFTHIVQLQVAMKKSRQLPAIYFQWLSYSDVRRPDVLYGYPKGIITYPFASINVPAWLAEGVAQYQRSNMYFDYWDSHRDMLLRTALLADAPIGFEAMGIFGSKNALQRERIYNQGFAFTSFLVDKFGEEILPKLSESLAKSGTFSVDKAFQDATGSSGKELFSEFTNEIKSAYRQAVDSLNLTTTLPIEENGFYNFYPKISPKGNKLGYLSNKSYHSTNSQLFIKERDNSSRLHAINIGKLQTSNWSSGSLRQQDPVIKNIQSSYSFSPDGDTVAFSRQKLTSYGERYNDLFIYDLNTDQEKRITHSQRLSSPTWHPAEKKLVAIQQAAGTTNLVTVDVETSEITPLTNFENGEQVYTPAWHPHKKQLFFSYSDDHSRDILSLDAQSRTMRPVLQDSLIDFRDPHVGDQGKYLYYSADPDGIFNIYRLSLEQKTPKPKKITSVTGGAFMPHVRSDTLYFAEFKADGYKISSMEINAINSADTKGGYQRDELTGFKHLPKNKQTDRPELYATDISELQIRKLERSDSLQLDLSNSSGNLNSALYPHENSFTSFSFYPVIRFDNYSQKNGANGRLLTAGRFGDLGENLLRDMKLGTYFSSREVTDNLNIFGSALFGLASEPSEGIGDFFSPARLTDLDRDLTLITEFRGLPFIKKRWSPTVSLEFYNLRRNVSDGLTVEEFPCTSCLPDTTHADIAYNIWEADIFLRSKINAHNLIEVGAGYSPYRVQTDGFFSRELEQFIPSSSSEYFRGTTFTAAHVYEQFAPYPNQDVAPIGLRTLLRYTYEPSKLLGEYEIEDGTLTPVYKSVKNHSLETSVRIGYPVGKNTTFNLYGRGFSYFNNPDDFFYLDYIGGFTGMRSYPYFAVGGNTTAMAQLSYTFPLVKKIETQVGRHTFDKLFLRLFAEIGNGWDGPLEIGNNLKTGVGAELRFAFNSYYLFPLKLFVSGAYGFNKFDVTLPDEFITESTGGSVEYGREPIFHFGLTFDFDLLNHD